MNIEQIKSDTIECKFCLEEDKVTNLISPCKCDGSLKYVHLYCLDKFHEKKYLENCMICGQNYSYDFSIITNKYYSLITIYTICILNNFFSTLITFDMDNSVFMIFSGYSLIYYYLFTKNKLFQVNIFKNQKISNPEIHTDTYNQLNNIYYNNIIFCTGYAFLYKLLTFTYLLYTDLHKKTYRIIYFLMIIFYIIKMSNIIKQSSKIKKIKSR